MDFVKIPTKQKKHNFIPENELGKQLRDFVLGNFLLPTNNDTDNHVTFKVKKHKEDDVWFVSTLGQYKVCFYRDLFLRKNTHSKNSEIEWNDQKVQVFDWMLNKFWENQDKYRGKSLSSW